MSFAKWSEWIRKNRRIAVIAGVVAVALLVAAVALPHLLHRSEEKSQAADVTAEPTLDPAAFEAETMIGRPLSALTAVAGEPTEKQDDLRYRWSGTDYEFSVVLSSDGETVREFYISRGPSLLGLHAGDSGQAALAALQALGDPNAINTVDSGDGQTSYAAANADLTRYYQFDCADGAITYYAVQGFDIPR